MVASSREAPLGVIVRITRDGRWLLAQHPTSLNTSYVFSYPSTTGKPVETLTNAMRAPFFSPDGRLLYGQVADDGNRVSVAVRPIIPAADGKGIRLGEGASLSSLRSSTLQSANSGAISRDGSRILWISADDSEELKMQVLTDWTTLLPSER